MGREVEGAVGGRKNAMMGIFSKSVWRSTEFAAHFVDTPKSKRRRSGKALSLWF